MLAPAFTQAKWIHYEIHKGLSLLLWMEKVLVTLIFILSSHCKPQACIVCSIVDVNTTRFFTSGRFTKKHIQQTFLYSLSITIFLGISFYVCVWRCYNEHLGHLRPILSSVHIQLVCSGNLYYEIQFLNFYEGMK